MTTKLEVTGCHDCPFFNNEVCNLGAGGVVTEWKNETMPVQCPLREGDWLVTTPNLSTSAIKKLDRIKLHQFLKKQFNENIAVEYQGVTYSITNLEAFLTANETELFAVSLLQNGQWLQLLSQDDFSELKFISPYQGFIKAVRSHGFQVPNGIDFYTDNKQFTALISPPKGSLDYDTVIKYLVDEKTWEFSINTSVCDRNKIGTGATLGEAVNDFNTKQNRLTTPSKEN